VKNERRRRKIKKRKLVIEARCLARGGAETIKQDCDKGGKRQQEEVRVGERQIMGREVRLGEKEKKNAES